MFLKALLVLFITVNGAHASGFQGLPWGASFTSIKAKFPEAQQDSPSTTLYPICKNSSGETYLCTISQQSCLEMGVRCQPPLRVKKYLIGRYMFELVLELSKDKTLQEVSLSLSEDLVGKTTSHGQEVCEFLRDSLKRRYGEPSFSEPYRVRRKRIGNIDSAYAIYQWRSDGTSVNLILSTRFDPETQRYVDVGGRPDISVIYAPIVNEAASKL